MYRFGILLFCLYNRFFSNPCFVTFLLKQFTKIDDSVIIHLPRMPFLTLMTFFLKKKVLKDWRLFFMWLQWPGTEVIKLQKGCKSTTKVSQKCPMSHAIYSKTSEYIYIYFIRFSVSRNHSTNEHLQSARQTCVVGPTTLDLWLEA